MAKTDASQSCRTLRVVNNFSELKEQEFSQEERASLERTIWKKFDKWILPLTNCFFLLTAVDAVNIGNARIAGLQESLAMSNYQFSLLLIAGHVPFILSEFPSTLLLKSVGPNLMLPAMITLWGAVSALQGLANNYSGLVACRLFQGVVGGGLYPGLILYLSLFYPRERLQLRVAILYATFSSAGGISGLLGAAIARLDGKGGKPGWAWIFILEGVFTFVFGVISFFLLPRSPEMSRLLTEKEQVYVVTALKHAGSVSEDEEKDKFSWSEVFKAIMSPHVWLLAIMTFFTGMIIIGVALFMPTIVSDLGYPGFKAQLMSMPPFAITFGLCIISARISDRYHCRGFTTIFFSLFQVIGFTMFYASTSNRVRYASLFFFVPGAFCVMPATFTWVANNSAPHSRRATAVAIAFIMNESGGVLSTWFLGSTSNYTAAIISFIGMSVGLVVLSSINLMYLRQQNELKAEKRQRMRKEEESECLGDCSAWFVYSL